jgi:SAM-dependent methyltransferase
MGIPAPIARAILQEHKYRPITGSGLLIGRQTMPFKPADAARIVREEGVALRPGIDLASPALIDTTTRYGKERGYINDVGFFSLFCDAKFRALDVTDYEAAEIVHDMCTPIPDDLAGTVDFMWNGSCLDNMFDPATAMRNTVRLLRPGGRVVLMEIGTPHHNAYTMYAPAYFFDYFAINNFADCKVYVCLFPFREINDAQFDLFVWKNYDATLWQFPLELLPPDVGVISYVVAEKGPNSTWDKNPVQGQYRPDQTPYKQAFERFAASPRPLMKRARGPKTASRYANFLRTPHPHIEFVGSL